MCRLYTMGPNEPTRAECSLIHPQNALMQQSRRDLEELHSGHGWRVADYSGGVLLIEQQIWAAFHGEHFSITVLAHVRRAAVGHTSIENTHPFQHGRWIFAHSGICGANRLTPARFVAVRMCIMAQAPTIAQSRSPPSRSRTTTGRKCRTVSSIRWMKTTICWMNLWRSTQPAYSAAVS